MHSRFMRIFILSLVVLTVASSAFAARRASLGGNLLIEDTDDVFIFPHQAMEHVRLVTFDLGTSSSLGSGGMIFGDDQFTFGAFSHRGDFLGAIPGAYSGTSDADGGGSNGLASFFDGFLGSAGPGSPMQWWDVMGAWEAGDMPWGARVSIGRDNDDPAGDDNQMDVTSFNFILSTEFNDIDSSIEFGFADAESQAGAGTTTKSTPIAISLGVRKGAVEESDDLQLGWLGAFVFANGTEEFTDGTMTNENKRSLFGFLVGAGPTYKPHDRTQVAMYGTFEFARLKDEETLDGAAGDEITVTSTVIPGWRIATEVEIASWLQARAGISSSFSFNNDKLSPPTGTESEDKDNSLDYSWHTGVGIQFDNFMIDAYFNPSMITSGTDILGNNSQAFGLVTASLGF